MPRQRHDMNPERPDAERPRAVPARYPAIAYLLDRESNTILRRRDDGGWFIYSSDHEMFIGVLHADWMCAQLGETNSREYTVQTAREGVALWERHLVVRTARREGRS